MLIDKNGHLKLSDFGLSTGLHKTTDAEYYKRFLEPEKPENPARNSVQVNPINLTMSREQIATWKANRRRLVWLAPTIYIGNNSVLTSLRRIPLLVHRTT